MSHMMESKYSARMAEWVNKLGMGKEPMQRGEVYFWAAG